MTKRDLADFFKRKNTHLLEKFGSLDETPIPNLNKKIRTISKELNFLSTVKLYVYKDFLNGSISRSELEHWALERGRSLRERNDSFPQKRN